MFSRKTVIICSLIAVAVALALLIYRQQLTTTPVLEMYLPIDTYTVSDDDGIKTVTVDYPLNRLSMSVFPAAVSQGDTVYIELKKIDTDVRLGTTQLKRFSSGTYLRGTVTGLEGTYAVVQYGIEEVAITEADTAALADQDNLTSHILIDSRGRATWHGFYRNGLPLGSRAL